MSPPPVGRPHLSPWVWEPLCASLALLAAGTSHTNVLRHCLPRSSYNPASAVPVTASTSSVRADKPTQATAGSTLTTSAKVLVSSFLGSTEEAVLRKTAEIISYLLRESPLVVEFCLPCKQRSIMAKPLILSQPD